MSLTHGSTAPETPHVPVLKEETVNLLALAEGATVVDGTLGAGGHAEALLDRMGGTGRLLGLDRDAVALTEASRRLARFGNRAVLRQATFDAMEAEARALGWTAVDGVLLDLGCSSMQLDDAGRGFSFAQDGPLDMRMGSGTGPTAADIVNQWPEADLADLFARLGEEPEARRIAAALTDRRARAPFRRTLDLADTVRAARRRPAGRIHPATHVFRALRMAVNDELGQAEAGMEAGLRLLRPGGRLAVITFHSIEDRLVKRRLRAHERREVGRPEGGVRTEGERPFVRRVTRKPVAPGAEESRRNPRARSARLRVVEKEMEP